jgi:hypothetical protein
LRKRTGRGKVRRSDLIAGHRAGAVGVNVQCPRCMVGKLIAEILRQTRERGCAARHSDARIALLRLVEARADEDAVDEMLGRAHRALGHFHNRVGKLVRRCYQAISSDDPVDHPDC